MSRRMRTTVRLSPGLLTEAKRFAAESHTTLTALIEDSLRSTLARRAKAATTRPVKLPTFGGGGLMPGVDLESSTALLDLMEEHRAAL